MLDVSDAQEPTAMEADKEYKLRIMSCVYANDKNGAPYLLPRFEVVDEPMAKDFSKFLRVPYDEQTPKDKERARWAIKEFLKAFGKDPSQPIDPTELDGQLTGEEGWAILGMKEDPEYGEQNFIRKFVLPK